MAAVERPGADGQALFIGDLFRLDQARRIACAGRGNGRIVGVLEPVAQADARPGGIDQGSDSGGGFTRHLRAILHCRPGASTGRKHPDHSGVRPARVHFGFARAWPVIEPPDVAAALAPACAAAPGIQRE